VELRKDREDTLNGIGGGLLIYTKIGLVIRKNLKFDKIKFNQFCALTIMAKDPLNLILVYRPPNSGASNMDKLCNILDQERQNTIIIGDFNAPDINWEAGQAGPKGRKIFLAAMEAGMDQMVDFNTHSRGNKLDLVLTNCPQRIIAVTEEGKLGNSNHSAILVTAEGAPERKCEGEKRRNWNKGDYDSIRKRLRETDWEALLNKRRTEENWQAFKQVVEKCVENSVPYYRDRKNYRPKWLTKEVMSVVRKKNQHGKCTNCTHL
jgi:hypothetical protein